MSKGSVAVPYRTVPAHDIDPYYKSETHTHTPTKTGIEIETYH